MRRPFLWIDIGWTLVYTSSESPGAGVPGPGESLRRQLGLPPSAREQLDRIVFEKNLRTPQALTKALTEELARHGPLREGPQEGIGLEACVQNFWRHQRKAPEPAAGAGAFLSWLRAQGWEYGLLSNITPPYWEGVVELFGRLVTEVPRVLSFEQGQSKPRRALFHQAEALAARSGAELAILGDDMNKDILPALGRGWAAVHVTSLRDRSAPGAPDAPGAPAVSAAGSGLEPPLSPLQVAERAVAFPAEGPSRYRICPDLEALPVCLSSFFDPSRAPVKLRGRGASLPVIASVEHLSSELIRETLRQVPLVGTPSERPYARATIEWDVAQKHAELYYAQLYLLKPQLEVIQSLASQLQKILARNPFRLDCGLRLVLRFARDEAVPQFCYWFPPILEEAFLPDGRSVLLVADGMHRVFLSSSYDRSHVSAIRVTNLDPAFPYYAYPQARDWGKLALLDAKPPPSARKTYREGANPKRLFRNYNALFAALQPSRR